ncbi:MAG: DUF5606 domain-containing protein [Flavobacteriales bacterium Tduv]
MELVDFSKIIVVSGKSGLYKLLSQTRQGFIIESLTDKKCSHLPSTYKISLMKDIAIYTHTGEISILDVFQKMTQEEIEIPTNYKKIEILYEYFEILLPDYDKSRVYDSDLKKIFHWYNILQSEGLLRSYALKESKASKEKNTTECPHFINCVS